MSNGPELVWRYLPVSATDCPASDLYKELQSKARSRSVICTSGVSPDPGGTKPQGNHPVHSTLRICARVVAASLGVCTGCSFEPCCRGRDSSAVPPARADTPTATAQPHPTNSPAPPVTAAAAKPQPHHETASLSPGQAPGDRDGSPAGAGGAVPTRKAGTGRNTKQIKPCVPAAAGTQEPNWELNSTKRR